MMEPPEYDTLHNRGRAFEEAYFHERDAELLDALKRKLSAEETEKVLVTAIGIADELSIKDMTKIEAGVQVLTAMALLPLVEVAWCDGDVSAEEHRAIMKATAEFQMESDSAVSKLLQSWLQRRPTPESLAAWKNYVKAICATVEPETMAKLKQGVIGRAEKIAKAAGGILGFGSKVSATEQACLDELAKSFCK